MIRLLKFIFVETVITIFCGCAPAGPVPPMLGVGNIDMLLLVLVAGIGYFIWHRLTVLSSKLEELKKEIEKLKNKTKGGDHD